MASEHDEKHRACRGSECQIQLHVNSPERRQVLDASVLEALPTLRAAGAKRLDWRSPLHDPLFASDHPLHEYRDGKVLDAIGRSDLRSDWRAYWPGRSQKWDAIAIARDSGGASLGPVLVEAKSYPGEFRDTGGGSAAKGDRLTRIEDRLRETRQWLGVEESPQIAERWIGDLYQSANRFATLRFFRAYLNPPADAWLLSLYFLNDRTHKSSKRATTREEWEAKLPRTEADLGLKGKPVAHSGRAFVDAGTYDELVAATGG